jgi:hypothetical protein
MKIDIFAHIIPPKFGALLLDSAKSSFTLKEHISHFPPRCYSSVNRTWSFCRRDSRT